MNINQELTLNLSADGIPPRLHMVQGDANTRTVVATLWDGAQPYTVPAASAVMIRFRKPDGTGGLYDTTESGAQVTVSGNTVTAPVATQMLAVAGVVQAQVDIYGTATGKAAEKLATFRFAVEVAPSVYPDAEIISSDYFNIIAADIGKAVEAAARAEAAQAAASAAQQGAESARDDAVNAKTAAESAKTAAVAAQKKSEAAQTKAETAQTTAGQSAAAAQTAKEGAETAQTGAQAAQAAAESAKAAAQAAQTGAETARTDAETAKGAAEDSAEDAEAWAVGQRNGTDVPSTDPTYHNNAKYYKDQAQTIAGGEFVSYGAPQPLTAEQQAQARDNINAPAPYEAGDNISITGRIITTKAFPCNPGLTDNGYFGNPVNQRGQTSYAGAGYSIDRWKLFGDNVSATINGGVQCTASSFFYQVIEQQIMDALDGRAITLSALLKDNRLLYGTWTVDNSVTNNTTIAENEIISLVRAPWAGNAWGVYFKVADAVVAVKLELGPQQTLAHKEYGEWVLNEIPKLGDQLAECQRYLFAANGKNYPYGCVGSGFISSDGTEAVIIVPTPVSLRTLPVCEINGVLRVDTSHGEIVTINDVAVYNIGSGAVCIHGKFTGTATAKAPCYALLDTGHNLLLSAEL